MSVDLELTPLDVAELVERIGRNEDAYRLPPELIDDKAEDAPRAGAPIADPDAEINQSIFQLIRTLSVGEKIKLALKGNRDARNILLRDGNRMVPRFVLQNPRVSDEEIVGMARNRNLESELLRVIGDHKEWSRNPQVRAALVSNPKAPLVVALRFVNGLSDRELRQLAKSKNIPTAVSGTAKRILLTRTNRG